MAVTSEPLQLKYNETILTDNGGQSSSYSLSASWFREDSVDEPVMTTKYWPLLLQN